MKRLVLGTRGSPLALAQTEIVRGLLLKAHPGLRIETRIIKTSGDQFHDLSLVRGGGKGLFTKEIEEQLLARGIDVAVHSMKDLPTELPQGLTIGAVPPREDAHDVLVSERFASLEELPPAARVATSSLRRRAQLLARRPDLQVEEIRGNIGTRLRKASQYDAIILAAAGLIRLGLKVKFSVLDFEVMIPAVGQGAIACEVRERDFAAQELLAAINDADTLAATEAERMFLRAMGGGCQVPYAAHGTVSGEQLHLIGATFSPDGRHASRAEATGPKSEPRELGRRVAGELLQRK